MSTDQTNFVIANAQFVDADKIPLNIAVMVINAAIAVGWAAKDGGYQCNSQESSGLLELLCSAVDKASEYTTERPHKYF